MKKLRITVEGKSYDVTVEVLGETGGAPAAAPAPSSGEAPAALSAPAGDGGGARVLSQLAGTVVSVAVEVGQQVSAGESLLVIEAMKMNTPVTAPQAGTVASVAVAAGDAVEEGQVLVTLN